MPVVTNIPDLNDIIETEEIDNETDLCTYLSNADQFYSLNDLKVLHVNIRGLQSNLDRVKVMLDDFYDTNNAHFDILMFSETWLTHLTTSLVEIPNYHAFHAYRTSTVHGGVSLYIKDNVKLSDIEDVNTDFIEQKLETLTKI